MNTFSSVAEVLFSIAALLSATVFSPASIPDKAVGDAFSAEEFNELMGSVQLFSVDDNDTVGFLADDKLGIGKSDPVSKLDVAGDIRASGDLFVTKIYGDGSGLTNIGSSGAGSWIKTGDDLNYPDGKVGIGAGLPEAYLDIAQTGMGLFHIGSDAGSDLSIDVGGSEGLVNLVAGAEFDTTDYTYTGSRGASRLQLHDGSLNLMTGDTVSGTAGNSVSWNTGLYLDHLGAVGVGTTSPQYKLDIAEGQLRVSAPNDSFMSALFSSADDQNYLQIQTTNGTPVSAGTRILSGSSVVAVQDYDIANNRWAFYAGSDAPSALIMTLKNNGRVGIGVTNPTEMLQVDGNIAWGSGLLTVDEGGSLELGDAGSNPYIDFKNDPSSDYDVRLSLTGNDTLEIAGGTLVAPEPTNATEVAIKSYVDDRTAFAELTNTTVADINTTSGVALTFNTTALHNSDTNVFTPVNTGFQILESGVYELQANIYMTASVARSNVGIELTINGTKQGVRGAGAYIRNSNGHTESSAHVSQILTLSTNDIVGVTSTQLANGGNVTMPAGQSNLIIKRLE